MGMVVVGMWARFARRRAICFKAVVTPGIDLSALTDAQKDALILELLPLVGQLETALARIAELEARVAELTRQQRPPPKTPDNSSIPPSRGQKPNRPEPPPLWRDANRRRRSRPGVGRGLHENPDRVVDAKLAACPYCAAAFPAEAQSAQHVYDRIEIPPPIHPDVTRVRLFGGACPCCGQRATAQAPAGLEPGSPFGRSVEALVVYLHYAHAVGLERLRLLMGEVFGLSISEGALSNMLARAQARLGAAASAIAAAVRNSRVVCCDETGARVAGKGWWEWVFATGVGVLHLIRPSRGKNVPQEVFGVGPRRPEVWVSDAFGSQRGHAERWQWCLAHLLRDTQYAIDCGDRAFAVPLKRLLLRAIAIGQRRPRLKDSTLAQYRADLDRRLDKIMAATVVPQGRAGEKLRRRIGRDREHLFTFVTDRDVPPTNNVSERNLRPSVVFRKVTNGFRSEWGAAAYAAFRTIASTAKLHGRAILDALRDALATPAPNTPG